MKRDFEKLKDLDGSTVTPEIMDVIQQMKTILDHQIVKNIMEANKADQSLVISSSTEVSKCTIDYDAQIGIGDSLKGRVNDAKAHFKKLQAKMESKLTNYFSVASLFAKAYKMQREVCCKKELCIKTRFRLLSDRGLSSATLPQSWCLSVSRGLRVRFLPLTTR